MKKFIILLIIIVAIFGFWYYRAISAPADAKAGLIYFTVEKGESLASIGADLQKAGLIKNPFAFKLYGKFQGAATKIMAGEYNLSASMSIKEIIATLASGKNVNQEKIITIIEGWRASDMANYLENQRLFKKEEFLSGIKIERWRADYSFLADATGQTLEGYLFPDTYRVFNDAKPDDVIKKMLDNFGAKFTVQMAADLKNKNMNIFEAITLASIVEREALSASDKAMVADVFLKRLRDRIGLQSDATVNYITGKKDLRPSLTDLAIDSPYNTYKYRGLPPGPISNPGLISIRAVIYPATNDYFYFLTDQDGVAHYGRTYAEHQANIQKYLE